MILAAASDFIAGFSVVLSPLLMLSSCALLVWALQNRYSRIVHVARELIAFRARNPDHDGKQRLDNEINILVRRLWNLRNAVVGYYLAMICFLSTSILLGVAFQFEIPLGVLILLLFLLGLVVIAWTLLNLFRDALRSFDAIAEEIEDSNGHGRSSGCR